MKIIMGFLFAAVLGYHLIMFIHVLTRMNGNKIIPTNAKDVELIRKNPDRKLDAPTFEDQKWGIIIYLIVIVILFVIFWVGISFERLGWELLLFLFLPFAHSADTLNMFVIVKDGILSGSRFIPWTRIKWFEFLPIKVNHKFYGYSKEINNKGYELKLKLKIFTVSYVVANDEMKEKLTNIFHDYGISIKEDVALMEKSTSDKG